jgi:lipopolysaccharide O-acetyltransferase
MSSDAANRAAPLKALRFLRENGSYVFASEFKRRFGVLFRRWMLAKRLGCPNIVLGPRCFLRGLAQISIGENFQAAEGLWLEAITSYEGETFSPRIIIGHDVSVSRWSHIGATNRVEIGDGVLIGSKVLITDHSHGRYRGLSTSPSTRPALRPLINDREVVIERNVWLGDNVVVGPGARIGEGSVIGASAVVTGTIPPFTLAAGIPARPLKRFSFDSNEWIDIR